MQAVRLLIAIAVREALPIILETNNIWDSAPSIVKGSKKEGYTVWYSGKCSMPLDLDIVTDIRLADKEYDKQALEPIKN